MTDGVLLKIDELTTDQIVSILLGYVDQDVDTKMTKTLLTELYRRASSIVRDDTDVKKSKTFHVVLDEKLSQEEVDKGLKAASSKTDAGNRMDIQKLYDEYVKEIHKIENELSNIKKNLQLINKILEKQSNDEIINWDDVLPICRDCIYFFHKKDDVRFCVHFDSCCRAHRLLTEEK